MCISPSLAGRFAGSQRNINRRREIIFVLPQLRLPATNPTTNNGITGSLTLASGALAYSDSETQVAVHAVSELTSNT